MVITASAPGRAGIIGNPTDGYGGVVISCSLKQRAYVRLSPAKVMEFKINNRTLLVRKKEDRRLKGDEFDIFRAVFNFLGWGDLKAKIAIFTEIPPQAGLAGSTAILTSLLAAVMKLMGQSYHLYFLAEMVRAIELNYLKIQCGYQDAYMTVFGGLNYMDFRTKEFYRDFKEEIYATIEPLHQFINRLPFLVISTGVKRISGKILKPIRERWLEGDRKVVKGYQQIARLAQEGKKALFEQSWKKLGQLMNENHRIQQELGASGEENDRLIEFALKSGALGAKLAGAGGGGTIIVLTLHPAEIKEKFEKKGIKEIFPLKISKGLEVFVEE